MNISPISVLLIIMCLCTASCLVEKQEQERKKGKRCSFPKGTDGSVRNEGCIKSTCSNGKWKPTLRSDICCYNQKVHKPNTEIAKVVGEDNCTTIIQCEKDAQLHFKNEQCDVPSTKQQVDELEKNIEDQIREVVTKIENVNITNGEKGDEISDQVKGVENKIENVENQNNEVQKKIENMNKTIEKKVDGLYEKVDGLEKNIEDQIGEVVIKIENINMTNGDELSNQVKEVKNQIENVENQNNKVQKKIENMNKTIEKQVDGLYEKVDGLEKNIEDKIGEVVIKIENVNITNGEKGDNISSQVNEVEKRTEKIEKQVNGLYEKVDGLTENLDTLTELMKDSIADNNEALLQIKRQNTILTELMNNHIADPQCVKSYTTLKDDWRRIEYGVKHPTAHCDNSLTEGWYRFSFPSAPFAKIPTTAPLIQYVGHDRLSCGTYAVSWMEDSLPVIGQPPKDVTIYFAWKDRYPKHLPTPAKIVACSAGEETIYLYFLPKTPECTMAYCAL